MLLVLIPVAIFGWKNLYLSRNFFELGKPEIIINEAPRGVGLTPVSLKFTLRDEGAGLDEVIVRALQKANSTLLKQESLKGQHEVQFNVDIPGDRSIFEEGRASLEISVFDRSFRSNKSVRSVPLQVDYRRPKLEVITTQHNASLGGSQLMFYKVYDEALDLSGVKVGNQLFLGYPARGLDPDFEDKSLYVALYAVDMKSKADNLSIRAFAVDQVGNAVSVPFYNHVRDRVFKQSEKQVSEEFLREQIGKLAEQNLNKIAKFLDQADPQQLYKSAKSGQAREIEKFKLVNETLRSINQEEIVGLLKGPRFERYFEGTLIGQNGTVTGNFGDFVTFNYEGFNLGSFRREGYEFSLSGDNTDVLAAASGIVVFSDNIGVYGRALAIDHGLGLVSIYAFLDNVVVNQGERVTQGQKVAVAGASGFSSGNKVLFELRVHGVPVDAREWWDKRWYFGHITAKINEVKRNLGMPVYKPLNWE